MTQPRPSAAELIEAVHTALEPAHVSVWIRPGG